MLQKEDHHGLLQKVQSRKNRCYVKKQHGEFRREKHRNQEYPLRDSRYLRQPGVKTGQPSLTDQRGYRLHEVKRRQHNDNN